MSTAGAREIALMVEAALCRVLVANGADLTRAAALARLAMPGLFDHLTRALRDTQIRGESDRGRLRVELADAYGLDVRTVRRIIQGVHRMPPAAAAESAPVASDYHRCSCGAIISGAYWRCGFRSCPNCVTL